MGLFKGINYNVRGLLLGLRTPRLLLLGLIRFCLIIAVTAVAIGIILYFHNSLLSTIWPRPQSAWLVWIWVLISWLVTIILMGLSAVMAYLISQILFSIVIMDKMSRITEAMVRGRVFQPSQMGFWQQFIHLIKQEIPRAILPILFTLLLTILGWLTPFGPVVTLVLTSAAVVFVAWDNTDLTPARRLKPFGNRFQFLLKTIPFHLGFGLLFLIPVANILFLAFAPVGGTLYYMALEDKSAPPSNPSSPG